MNYNQSGFKLGQDHGLLHLSKIGDIRIKMHRKIKGCIKAILIKSEGRRWFAIGQADREPVCVEDLDVKELKRKATTKGYIGISMMHHGQSSCSCFRPRLKVLVGS